MKDNSNNLPEFSDTKRLQLVFADKNDYYYTDSLMKLNLNQYLWLALRQNYHAVWFVSVKMPKETVNVKRFPDDMSGMEKKAVRSFLCGRKAFDWVMDQANQEDQGKKQAFIMESETFVSLFEKHELTVDHKKTLKNNTIILLLPPNVQETKDLLLTSRAFDNLEAEFVTGLRCESTASEDIYGNLNDKCSDVCLFLHEYTVCRIKRLLTYSLMHHPKRKISQNILDCMAVYLTQYLNNRCLQWHDEEKLFGGEISRCVLKYEDIEVHLSADTVWYRLKKRAEDVQCNVTKSADKALVGYMKQKNMTYVMKCIYMMPEPNSVKDYYLNIDPQNHQLAISAIPEEIRASVLETYEKTYRLAYTAGNSCENEKCRAFLNDMMNQAIIYYNEPDIFFRYLLCIGQCMSWLYQGEDDMLNIMLDTLKDYMAVILAAFKKMPNWNEGMRQKLKGKIQEIDIFISMGLTFKNNVQELRDKISGLRKLISLNTMSAVSTGGYPPPVQPSSSVVVPSANSYPPKYNKSWLKS